MSLILVISGPGCWLLPVLLVRRCLSRAVEVIMPGPSSLRSHPSILRLSILEHALVCVLVASWPSMLLVKILLGLVLYIGVVLQLSEGIIVRQDAPLLLLALLKSLRGRLLCRPCLLLPLLNLLRLARFSVGFAWTKIIRPESTALSSFSFSSWHLWSLVIYIWVLFL